ncbi:hybrid sensor histidine kinase/response regulator [Xanthomonas cannabis]|uniref:hybrid sensor histidine kinase/response regulator n=1 Tax=Xanthomonas cannabis TaxID=1885674 RepID=UPI000574A06C|nr:ATP-binding protein [Xanthomonas cannabis]KHL52851.1 histidine kinase [Xanthomonas cannabis pv. cannabis]
MRGVLLVLVLLLTAFPVLAGVPAIPRFRIVGAAEGLPSTMITAIAQDRAGYLWMTTSDGLVRYDGADFKVWRNNPTDRYSLRSNVLQAMYIDDQDRIWLALAGAGLAMLSADRSKLTAYLPDDVPALSQGDIYAIAGRGDEIWLGMSTGNVLRLDAKGNFSSLDLSKMDHPLEPSPVYALTLDERERMWIGTLAGLAYHDGQAVHRVWPGGDASGINALQWVGQRLWASMDSGLRYMDASGAWHTPSWASMFATGNRVWTVADAGDGEFWLGTEQGLWHTRPGHPPMPVNNGDDPLVSNRHVATIWRSPHGGIWVPLHGRGLAYLREDWRRTAVFKQVNDQGKGISCSLAPANRSGGLWQFDKNGRLLRYDTSSGALIQAGIQHDDLGDMEVSSALEDSRGQLWLGNGRHALSRLDLTSGELTHFSSDGPGEAVLWLGEPGDGSIWAAFEQVIQRRDLATGRVLETISQTDLHGLQEAVHYQIGTGPDGRVWISGSGGLRAWDTRTHRFTRLPGLDSDFIQRFVVQDQNHVWLYIPGSIEHWELRGGSWTRVRRIPAAEGFPAMDAYGLELDMYGRVWLAGARGLWRIDPRTARAKIRSFGARDGLTSQEFSRRCLLMSNDGVLVGGTADGFTLLIDTKAPDIPSFTPQMRLEAVSVLQADRRRALPIGGGFSLAPDDRQLRINLRLLSFVDPMANHYRTRLQGFDTEWVELGAAGMREFSSLPPGNYDLEMQGIDPLGNASQVQSLRFTVLPPWWRSEVGIALICMLGLLLGALLAAAYRHRVRMRAQWQLAQHKRELAEQASLAKTRFLATLGHEVRTPMTGVLGMSELLLQTPLDARQQGYAGAIQSAGKHLLRLVNDALDLARIEAGKLPLDYRDFDLRQLIRQVVELVRPSAEQKQLAFECDLDDALPPALHGDASRVQQILLNLLFNAVKFTERGSVRLRVLAVPHSPGQGIRVEVRDTGPGMSAEQRGRLFQRFEQAEGALTLARHGGSGLGLAICRELAAAMCGAVSVSSELGQGACFVVELPLGWVAALPMATAASARAVPASEQAPLHLLLVEDDPTVAQVMIGLLQTRGHQVTHVLHGLAALAEVSTRSFDAGLCDLDLPGIDGAALVAQLRARGVRFPIVAVTARADADAEPQAMAAGCNGFLRKPVTGELLATALARALADAEDAQGGGTHG